MNVGGGNIGYAMCAGGNGLAMYKFDMPARPTRPARRRARAASRTRRCCGRRSMTGVTHRPLRLVHLRRQVPDLRPRAGRRLAAPSARRRARSLERTLFFIDPADGRRQGHDAAPARRRRNRENCTWHNFNVVPTKAGYYADVGSYQSGISVFDFIEPGRAEARSRTPIRRRCSTTPSTTGIVARRRLVDVLAQRLRSTSPTSSAASSTWELDLGARGARRAHLSARTRSRSNPQTQTASFAQEVEGADDHRRLAGRGRGFKQGSQQIADFRCGDDVGRGFLHRHRGQRRGDRHERAGQQVFAVTAVDTAGNMTTKDVPYMVNSVDMHGRRRRDGRGDDGPDAGHAAPKFGAFTPGVAREYLATRAGGSRRRPATRADGARPGDDEQRPAGQRHDRAVAGAAGLSATARAAPARRRQRRWRLGSDALVTYTGPVTNDAVTLLFRQIDRRERDAAQRGRTARR